MFVPGRGLGVGTAIIVGTVGLATVAGLAAGIGVEESKSAVTKNKLSTLQDEINLAKQVKDEINITPPGGKGFINR